jgi:hypothetical protein
MVLIVQEPWGPFDSDQQPGMAGPLSAQAREHFPSPGLGCGLGMGSVTARTGPHAQVRVRDGPWADYFRLGQNVQKSLFQVLLFSEVNFDEF